MVKKGKKKIKAKASRLVPWKFGLSMGILVGISVFIVTIIGYYGLFGTMGYVTLGISDFYGKIGYSVSVLGAVLGAVYSFVDAFVTGYVFAWIYNKML